MRETVDQVSATPLGFPYPNLETVSAQVRSAYESLPARLNLFRMLAHSQGLFVPLMDFTHAVFKNLSLARHSYELIVLFTAHRCDAQYEWRQHLQTAPRAGVRSEEIEAIERGTIDDPGIFDAGDRLLLRMASELIDNRRISPPTLARARDEIGPEQTLEVMLVVGFYQTIAGIVRSVDLDFNPRAAEALASSM